MRQFVSIRVIQWTVIPTASKLDTNKHLFANLLRLLRELVLCSFNIYSGQSISDPSSGDQQVARIEQEPGTTTPRLRLV